jgi:hypothetical protein
MKRGSTHHQSARSPAVGASRLVLTESERLTLLFTKVHGLPRTDVDWLVVPTASPFALCDKWRAPDALPGLDDPVRVQSVYVAGRMHPTPAWAWPVAGRLTRKQRLALSDGSVDHVLRTDRDGQVHALDVSGRWQRHRDGRDTRRMVASAHGPTLDTATDDLVPSESAALRRLSGRDLPGWVVVPLGVLCPTCGQPLLRIDHEYPGLNWSSRRQLILCAAERRAVEGPGAQQVGVSHRQLRAALPDSPASSGSRASRRVYVVEAAPTHDAPRAFYVGETSKTADERLREHQHGLRAARAFRSGRYYAERLRPDLIPALPETMDTLTAKAAERFTASVLRWQGLSVLGGT